MLLFFIAFILLAVAFWVFAGELKHTSPVVDFLIVITAIGLSMISAIYAVLAVANIVLTGEVLFF